MGNGTSIGRVRGLGAAKEGTHHWLVQRFTAVGNLLLLVWLAVSLIMLPDLSYATVREWLSSPLPAVAMGLLIISFFWHARLGMQVMLEDYVHEGGNKFAAILILNLVAFAGAAFGLFCVIRLALGGA
ncbi:succinate dehydrogenase, hydrophobic membrane anchor protein [Novosphingobium marinum]|uniref:Succinate dehydrogenase hydrophobic membrane anchor subunit n=1 Tax=Novosphingobium marinum TaxID=1514948 RepID=A0A7Z0BU41_9SPHN|nr:succinate dehydrogenase, hydrophobic membrane anchor protein [Novosphingobium marinum]NYH93907.1 succinate dehydrogenase / fumarate reductase membrane anchor subunit [Novosphingobium marinum]GGC18191.1 succinate dehydrogenase, hydrophobic membrane anchor protein [Novosphingobium marinum]